MVLPPSTSSASRLIQANPNTTAARFNRKIIRALQAKLKTDPEVDLSTLLKANYSEQLRSFKAPSKHFSTRFSICILISTISSPAHYYHNRPRQRHTF